MVLRICTFGALLTIGIVSHKFKVVHNININIHMLFLSDFDSSDGAKVIFYS